MPIDYESALARPATPPPADSSSVPPASAPAERGLDIAEFFAKRPKPPTLKERAMGAGQKLMERLAPQAELERQTTEAAVEGARAAVGAAKKAPGAVARAVGDYAEGVRQDVRARTAGTPLSKPPPGLAQSAKSALDAGIAGFRGAYQQYQEDFKDPEAEGKPLHGLKTAMDLMNVAIAPLWEAGRQTFAGPLHEQLDRAGELLSKAASPEEAKKKGIDWKLHKSEVKNAVDAAHGSLDMTYDFLTMWATKGAVEEATTEAVAARARAQGRIALRDLREATDPKPDPKAKPSGVAPVTAALDKTLGFEKVTEVIGKNLRARKIGDVTTAGDIISSMIPHAKGYAKSFLDKLYEKMDKSVRVEFASQQGARGAAGMYLPEGHRIIMQANLPNYMVHTAVHEIVHSNTVNMIDDLIHQDLVQVKMEKGRDLSTGERMAIVNSPRSPVLKELDAIIEEVKIRAQKAGIDIYTRRESHDRFYGVVGMQAPPGAQLGVSDLAFIRMSPRYEFVAEVFSNPKLQEFMANSEKYASASYKWRNMLNQLSNLIARHLGLRGHEVPLLTQAMKVGTQLMTLQERVKPPHVGVGRFVIGRLGDEAITEGEVEQALMSPVRDSKPVREAKKTLAISVEQILRGIAPEALGQKAKLAASVIASRITELEQRTSAWRYGSRTREKFWRSRPDLTANFIEMYEKGKAFADPILDKISKHYKDWGERIFQQDMKTGFTYEARENYLYHTFEDSEGVAAYFEKKYGSKWGDPSFIKDRTFDLYKEAIEAGFKPRFNNPEDIMLARQHASDVAAMHAGILEDLASYGLATRKVKGGEQIVRVIHPDGTVSFEVKTIKGTKQPEGTTRRRSPTGDVFWVNNEAHAVLHNAFDSFSLWSDKGLLGAPFRGMMFLKNSLVPIRLALSLFHPMHVAGIDVAAGWTRATSELMSGHINPVTWLGKMLRSGISPVESSAMGWRVMEAWKGKIPAEKLSVEDAEALKILIETGVAPETSSAYRTNARQNFGNALIDTMASLKQGRAAGVLGGVTRTAFWTPWAMISAMGKPIFEVWIPQLKAASAIKDAKSILARNPELLENDAARIQAMRRIGKSIDNRYGEMAYNKLFWQRWIKDVAVLDTLSLGWQLGFLREYGGGALDLGQWAVKGDKIGRIRRGELDKAIFVSSYTALGAGMAGMMTWAMTGEFPTGMDYINPRTGEKDPDGSDQRVTTMFYSREFASLYKHIQNEGMVSGVSELVLNKGSGLYGLMHEWATGVNGFGQEIRNPDGDAFQKLEETIAYSTADMEPITRKAVTDSITEGPTKGATLSILGFNPQPKYMSESVTASHIKQAFRTYVAPRETPFERAEYSKEFTRLREAYDKGSEKYGEMLDDMTKKFDLSGADQRRIIRSLNSPLTSEQRMFMRLPWEEQIKILDKASDEERESLLPHSNKQHVRNRWVPPEQRQEGQ